jgi:uncharacterized membrane protein
MCHMLEYSGNHSCACILNIISHLCWFLLIDRCVDLVFAVYILEQRNTLQQNPKVDDSTSQKSHLILIISHLILIMSDKRLIISDQRLIKVSHKSRQSLIRVWSESDQSLLKVSANLKHKVSIFQINNSIQEIFLICILYIYIQIYVRGTTIYNGKQR